MRRRAFQHAGATTSGACALAGVPEQPRRAGGRDVMARAHAVRPGRLTLTTRQIAAARRRDAERRAERARLEVLVHRLDAVIDACERAHLADLGDAPPTLAAQARGAIAAATAVLTAAGDGVAGNVTVRVHAGMRITEVMDAVWEVQDAVLDLLVPARRELPDAVQVDAAVTPVPSPPRPGAQPRRAVRPDRAAIEAVLFDPGVTWAELLRSAQRIWAWPVGSRERARLCAASTRAVERRMSRRRVGVGVARTKPAMLDVLPQALSRGCAHCGQRCEWQDAAGLRYCSTEHLLLARITGVGDASQTWRSE
jgi:hypothetical protein